MSRAPQSKVVDAEVFALHARLHATVLQQRSVTLSAREAELASTLVGLAREHITTDEIINRIEENRDDRDRS